MTRSSSGIVSFGRRRILPLLHRHKQRSSSASFSTSTTTPSPLVTAELLEEDERIAMIRLHRNPVNALSLEMCEEISKAIKTVETEKRTATTMVLASSLPSKIFSAGLDISNELYKPDLDRLPKFWWSFQQLFLDLYGSTSLTTVASLEGPAPAGGCMLALACDYRIMAADSPKTKSKSSIGLNESHLGIVAPPWMCQQYIDILGHRKAEISLLSGILFPPNEALNIGLVDELVDPGDEESSLGGRSSVDQAAIQKAKEFAAIPAEARAGVKKLTRGPLVKTLTKDREKDVDLFCEFVTSEKVQAAIGQYLQALASRASKKKK